MDSPNHKGMRSEELDTTKMPGHWLLARLGKRVLRPGGRELTRQMLDGLDIQPSDDVVEFAPGLGFTAQLTLNQKPASYTAVERDEAGCQYSPSLFDGTQSNVSDRTGRRNRTPKSNSNGCLR